MGRIVLFGEIMLRLNPEGYLRIRQADKFDASYAGGEANVAVSLANYQMDASFVTKVPDNEIANAAMNELRKFGVRTSDVVVGGERLGIYFLEKGASQRPSKVIYDRKHSSIAMASREDFNWDVIFEDAEWFHFTGITPALGDNVAEICMDACKAAKSKGITISCDLNYRKNLWSGEKAGHVMASLMTYVDVCIANEEDAEKVFGIKAENTDVGSGQISHEGYKTVAKQLADRFCFSIVAITLRGSISANDNNWAGMLYDNENYYFSKEYAIHIVDRVGGGDSFGGGLIYALLHAMPLQQTIDFAVAASCLKHTIEFDFNQVTVEDVMSLMHGDSSGRVKR